MTRMRNWSMKIQRTCRNRSGHSADLDENSSGVVVQLDDSSTINSSHKPTCRAAIATTAKMCTATRTNIRRRDCCSSNDRIGARAHLLGMISAPIILFGLTFAVVHTGKGWFTVADFTYLGTLGSMILIRRGKSHRGRSPTAFGELADSGVLILGLAIWAVANLLGNYLLSD